VPLTRLTDEYLEEDGVRFLMETRPGGTYIGTKGGLHRHKT
jgi:hypothetical protein